MWSDFFYDTQNHLCRKPCVCALCSSVISKGAITIRKAMGKWVGPSVHCLHHCTWKFRSTTSSVYGWSRPTSFPASLTVEFYRSLVPFTAMNLTALNCAGLARSDGHHNSLCKPLCGGQWAGPLNMTVSTRRRVSVAMNNIMSAIQHKQNRGTLLWCYSVSVISSIIGQSSAAFCRVLSKLKGKIWCKLFVENQTCTFSSDKQTILVIT